MKKKLLLCITAAAFMVACGGKKEDPLADIRQSVASYNDACAQVAFKDTKETLARVDQLEADGMNSEARDLYVIAQEKYDKAVADYAALTQRADRVNAEIRNQNSRMNAIDSSVAPAEFNTASTRVKGHQALAQRALEDCDVARAEGHLQDADREIRYIEDLVKARSSAVKPAPTTSEVYTVVKGDSLWKIAASKYSNPYFWPLIYWANSSSIKDPDLIFPDQKFVIERNSTDAQKADAEKLARTRGPWSLFDNK